MDNNDLGRIPSEPGAIAYGDGAASVSAHTGNAPSRGPELEKLAARFRDSGTTYFHASWEPGAADMTAEERAALINAVMDECDHPVLGLAASLSGEAFLFEDEAHQRYNVKTGEYIPLTSKQKRAARTAELLKRAAEMLRELHAASAIETRSAETERLGPKDESAVA